MTPKEINKLAQQSPVLKRSLKMRNVYTFLRKEEVAICCEKLRCDKCNELHGALLASPYNGPHPGWCIECVLHAFFADEPLYDKYLDPRSKDYNPKYYDLSHTIIEGPCFEIDPDDYDGPPIALG
jgi:hypothetical protein